MSFLLENLGPALPPDNKGLKLSRGHPLQMVPVVLGLPGSTDHLLSPCRYLNFHTYTHPLRVKLS